MAAPSSIARRTDIIEAVELIRAEIAGVALQNLESDKRKRWLIERGIEIISEASRHLTDELKARHPQIPWWKVAGIGREKLARERPAEQKGSETCLHGKVKRAAPLGDGAAVAGYSAAARVGVCAAASTAEASLATRVPSKKRGFCVPHSLTALEKVKARKSSAVMWPSSTSS